MKAKLVAALVAAMTAAGSASAGPGLVGSVEAPSGLSVLVHGRHFDCRWSPEFGWHNHSNAQARPEPCRADQIPRDGPGRGGFGRGPDFGGRERRHDWDNACHFDCRWSREHGWHNHSNAQCRPEPCRR